MVSGFLISPNDHERIFSGLAMAIWIWSNACGAATGANGLVISWFILVSREIGARRTPDPPLREESRGRNAATKSHRGEPSRRARAVTRPPRPRERRQASVSARPTLR